MNMALAKTLAHISDAFRDERKHYEHVLHQACCTKELVDADRFALKEAIRRMGMNVAEVREALAWIEKDNARLNADHGVDNHRLWPWEEKLKTWIGEIQ